MQRNGACAGSSAPIFHSRSAAGGIIHLTFGFTRADQVVQIQGGRLSGIHGSLLRDCCRDPCLCRHGRRCRGHEHRTRNDGLQLYGNEGACGQLYHQYGHRHPDREAQPCPCAGNCKSGGRYHVPLAWCRHPEDVKTTRINARPLRTLNAGVFLYAKGCGYLSVLHSINRKPHSLNTPSGHRSKSNRHSQAGHCGQPHPVDVGHILPQKAIALQSDMDDRVFDTIEP